MKKHLSAVRKLLGSADLETVQSGIEMVRDLNKRLKRGSRFRS